MYQTTSSTSVNQDSNSHDDDSHRKHFEPLHSFRLPKSIQPYVCSTVDDFKEEHAYLSENVFPILDKLCKQRGSSFLPVDIQCGYDDTEHISDHTLSLYLYHIKKCSPFFICLLGDRYGPCRNEYTPLLTAKDCNNTLTDADRRYTPWLVFNYIVASQSGHDWILYSDYHSCSIVELQIIQAAFLNDSHHCNFYFRHRDYDNDNRRHSTAEERDVDASLRLENLKHRIIKKGLPVKYFHSLEELGQLVLDDWTSVINLLCPPIPREVLVSTSYQEWQANEVFLRTRYDNVIQLPETEQIVDRLTEFSLRCLEDGGTLLDNDDLVSDAKTSATAVLEDTHEPSEHEKSSPRHARVSKHVQNKSVLVLHGTRGCGKSTLLAEWLYYHRCHMPHLPVLYIFVGSSSHNVSLAGFMRKCVTQLRKHYISKVSGVFDTNLDSDIGNDEMDLQTASFTELCELFLAAISLGPCVICIDGIDKLIESSTVSMQQLKGLSWLPVYLPSQCKIILSTVTSDLTYRNLLKRRDTECIEIVTINQFKTCQFFLEKRLGSMKKLLKKHHLRDLKSVKASLNPLLLTVLANEIKCIEVRLQLDTYLDSLIDILGMRELWVICVQRWIAELSWTSNENQPSNVDEDVTEGWVPDVLRLIAIAKDGLSQSEILAILHRLGYVDEYYVSAFHLMHLCDCLADVLYLKPDGVLRFSHQSLQESTMFTLFKGCLQVPGSRLSSHGISIEQKQQMALYHHYIADYFMLQPHTIRKTEELPWQLMMAEDIEQLSSVIFSPDIFAALISSNVDTSSVRICDIDRYLFALTCAGHSIVDGLDEMLYSIGLKHRQSSTMQSADHDDLASFSLEDDDEHYFTDSIFLTKSYSPDILSGACELSTSYDRGFIWCLAWGVIKVLEHHGHNDAAKDVLLVTDNHMNEHYPLSDQEQFLHSKIQEALGKTEDKAGSQDEAEIWFRKSLQTLVAIDYNNFDRKIDFFFSKGHLLRHHGNIQLLNGNYDDAEEFFLEALDCCEQCANNLPMKADIYFSLGNVRWKQQRYELAERYYQQSISIREIWYGKSHPKVAEVLLAMAQAAHKAQSAYSDLIVSSSELIVRRALKIIESFNNSNSLPVATVLLQLGDILQVSSARPVLREALALKSRALDIQTQVLGSGHVSTRTTQQQVYILKVRLNPKNCGSVAFAEPRLTESKNNKSRRNKPTSAHSTQHSLRTRNSSYSGAIQHSMSPLTSEQRPASCMRPSSGKSASSIHSNMSAVDKILTGVCQRLTNMEKISSISTNKASTWCQEMKVHQPSSTMKNLQSTSAPEMMARKMNFYKETTSLPFARSTHTPLKGIRHNEAVEYHPRESSKHTAVNRSQKDIDEGNASEGNRENNYREDKEFDVSTHRISPAQLCKRYGITDDDDVNDWEINCNKYPSSDQKQRPANLTDGHMEMLDQVRVFSDARKAIFHKSRCVVPNTYSTRSSNTCSTSGPHSSIYCLLQYPHCLNESSRQRIQHKAAWYHVPGRYQTVEQDVPPKRMQSRPGSCISKTPPISCKSIK